MEWTSENIRSKVRCSACQGEIPDRINLVALNRVATWKYPTAGNVLTGESGQACAILCDGCIEAKREIVEAVEVRDDEAFYHPLWELLEIAPQAPEPEEGDGVLQCWCGAEGEYDDLFCDEDLAQRCYGTGSLNCYCGGDQCVCHHHGATECPGCDDCEHGDLDFLESEGDG